MKDIRALRFLTAAVAAAALLLLSGASLADPPIRVARLSFFSGPVSFSPAGEDEWVLATPNRPIITGDRLWADAGARAELQAGGLTIRLGESTNVNVLDLDDRATQLDLAQGSLYVRLSRLDSGEMVEIDTPNLAFTISRAGRYRIDVDPDGNVTTLAVLAGEGEAYGEGAAYRISAGERYAFRGTGLGDYEYSDVGPPDEFDRWASDRDRRYESSRSARYVAPEVIGYQDLDEYGTWSVVASYGNVWYPRSTPSGWAPYRTGHWSWIDPWGWTWIDDAPWGFAPYHYGRWAYIGSRWGWIPGPVNARPVYAPALVAFIGGGDLRLSVSVGGGGSGVAWFPLGPGEVYEPAYRVSRNYFERINVSNTRITNINITNVYNNYANNTTVTNITYRNREAPGAVTAVPASAFVQSQPVARAAVQLPHEALRQQPVSYVARVAPTRASLVSAAAASGAASAAKPPARALQREVVARTRPPGQRPAFAARQAALAANPGRPVEATAAAQPQAAPAQAAPAKNIKVVAPDRAAAPAPKDQGRRARGLAGERPSGAPAGQAGAAKGQQAGAPAAKAAPAAAGAPTGAGQAAAPQRLQEQQRQQAEQKRQQQQSQQAEQQRQQAEQKRQQQQSQQAEQQRQAEQKRQQQQSQQAEQQRQAEQKRQQQQTQQAEQQRQAEQKRQQQSQQAEQQRQAEQKRQQQQNQQAEQQRQAEQKRQQQSQQAEQQRQAEQKRQQQQNQQAEQKRQQQQSQQAEQQRKAEQQRQQREASKADAKQNDGKGSRDDQNDKNKKGSEGQ